MTVIVTGAGSGIGRATVVELLRTEPVLALDRNHDRLEGLASDLAGAANPLRLLALDTRDADGCRRAVRYATEQIGGFHGLAHCAGSYVGDARLAEIDDDAWDTIIGGNLTGTANILRACLPPLLDAGSGDLVVVSSLAGIQGRARLAAYSASKAGMLGLVRSVVADYAVRGIRINAVCPGATETKMTAGLSTRPPSNGPGRPATPTEIASVIAWLLSPAAGWINGAEIPVDAGEVAAMAWSFVRDRTPRSDGSANS